MIEQVDNGCDEDAADQKIDGRNTSAIGVAVS